jgi:TonB family protein
VLPGRTTYLGAFTFSCALHLLAVVLAVFLFATRNSTPIAPAIITLLPMAQSARTTPEQGSLFAMPLLAPPRSPSVREPRAADRTTAPEVKAKPPARPSPTAVKPARAVTKPSLSQNISYAEFQQLHGGAKPSTGPRTALPRVSERFDMTSGTTGQRAAAVGVVEQTFAEDLLNDLREAFAADAVFAQGLGADVEFSIRADGVITGLRIATSSGDRRFDAAVLEAFRRIRAKGFLKSDVGQSFVIHFKVSGP